MVSITANYTLGLVDLPPDDRDEISRIIEDQGAPQAAPWLVLYTDSCNLMIVDRNSAHRAARDQIIVRVYDHGETADDELALTRPLKAHKVLAVLARAGEDISKRRRQNPPQANTQRRQLTVRANEAAAPLRGGIGRMKRPLVLDSSAALRAFADHDYPGAENVEFGDLTDLSDNAAFSIAESWADVAIALYSVMQTGVSTIARIEVPDRGIVEIDFKRRLYFCEGSLNDFPLVPHILRLTMEEIDDHVPAANRLTKGRSLDQFLWFVGKHAFGKATAPWICREDSYRLRRWPNFTELQHNMQEMRLTAALGNRYLSLDALAATTDMSPGDITRVINAYSLMGLLQTSATTFGGLPPEVSETKLKADAETQEAAKPFGLFGKLIAKLGF